MSEFRSAEEREERYRYVKDPGLYLSEDVFRAHFVDVKKAVANNPERSGMSSTILAVCYMAFGSERVDLSRLGPDVLLPRLNKYLSSYNDQIDVAEKVRDSDPDVYKLIMDQVEQRKEKLEQYFLPTGDEQEDERRKKVKKYLGLAMKEVDAIEHELFKVADPAPTGDAEINAELERIWKGRELVNAIDQLMNLRACVEPDIYEERGLDQDCPLTIKDLSKKYDWLINPDYNDDDLDEDEEKARMMFFSSMAIQFAADIEDCKEDINLKVWKITTYMIKVLNMQPKEMKEIIGAESANYAGLTSKYGMSSIPVEFLRRSARFFAGVKNSAMYKFAGNFQELMAKMMEKRGHLRERAITMLQKNHPGEYRT